MYGTHVNLNYLYMMRIYGVKPTRALPDVEHMSPSCAAMVLLTRHICWRSRLQGGGQEEL